MINGNSSKQVNFVSLTSLDLLIIKIVPVRVIKTSFEKEIYKQFNQLNPNIILIGNVLNIKI